MPLIIPSVPRDLFGDVLHTAFSIPGIVISGGGTVKPYIADFVRDAV
jgi:hypothetical protein